MTYTELEKLVPKYFLLVLFRCLKQQTGGINGEIEQHQLANAFVREGFGERVDYISRILSEMDTKNLTQDIKEIQILDDEIPF